MEIDRPHGPNIQQEDWQTPTGWQAGEPFTDEFSVPEFVQGIVDRLQVVRTAIGELEDELWPVSGTPYFKRSAVERLTKPDPIEKARIQDSLEPLRKEEERLEAQFSAVKGLLPPLLEPPHNGKLTVAKAEKILKDGTIRGHPITDKQRKFFGFVAGGGKPTKQKGK